MYSVTQLYPTLCEPMDCSSPVSSVHGILQARILEWVAISSCRGSSGARDQTHLLSCKRILYPLSHLGSPNTSHLKYLSLALTKKKKKKSGFPGGASLKEPACQCSIRDIREPIRDMGSIPGLGRSPGEGNGNPLQYSCLESPMDRGAWGSIVHGVTKRHD